MYKINSDTKHSRTLFALSYDDEKNIDKRKPNTFFEHQNDIFWIMPLQADFSAGIFEKALFAFFQSRTAGINVDIDSFIKCAGSEKAQQIITTLITSSEQFNDISACYKTDKGIQRINNFVVDITKYKDEVYVAEVTADACNFAKKLITMPGNMMSANDFEAEIKSKFASIPEVKLSVLNKKDLESKKMGLILAVGKQSTPEQEPRIIIAEYNNAQDKKKLAVVGKGITFDTGGLNIKTDNHMIGMHADMAGAAISLATMYVAAKLKINTNLVCLACCVSNETGPEAYRVNDVITAYNGKTVEISNTDAEGRLALADGVSYANKDLKADTIITVATLTGALRFALGTTFTGIWSTNEDNWQLIKSASSLASEEIWRLPFHPDFQKLLNVSNIADIVNCSLSGLAGSSTAAEFIKYFIGDSHLIHADIAFTSEYKGRAPSPVYVPVMVRTFIQFAKQFGK